MALWPIYVFLFLNRVDRVGWLYSLSFLLAMLLSILMGIYIDHSRHRRSFLVSGGVLSLLWIIRANVWSIWGMALVDAADRLIGNFHWLWYDTLLYRTGQTHHAWWYFTVRELVISLTGVVFWLAVGLTFILIENAWLGLFGLAAVGVLLSALMSDFNAPSTHDN